MLPLTRARDFLKTITSFAGLIEPFINPDFSLYYTLTRRLERVFDNGPVDAKNFKLGERTLYITVFDHKERTTRVYTRDKEMDTFYSTKSDAPLFDVGHFLLEVEIDANIDPKGDPVYNHLDSLREHHQSILEHIQYRLGATDVTKSYTIENSWTMKAEDTISTLQRLREENGDDWKSVVEKGKEEERNEESSLICDYFKYSSAERERRRLYEIRVRWITRRMEMIVEETKGRFQLEGKMEYRVDKQAVEKKHATKSPEWFELLLIEKVLMELLLIHEVMGWEQLFWNKFKVFLDQFVNDRVEEKENLTREWRANCWKRLIFLMHGAEKRLENDSDRDDSNLLEFLGDRSASSISQLFERVEKGVEIPNPTSLFEMKGEIEKLDWTDVEGQNEEVIEEVRLVRLRIEKEVEDSEFRLNHGSELGLFNRFWDNDTLFECRYSRSKWLDLRLMGASLEIYLHALKQNRNTIHIIFSGYDSDSDVNWLLSRLPRVTSMSRDWFEHLPAIDRDSLYIKSTPSLNNDLITFAKEIRLKLPVDDFSTYIFTDAGSSDMYEDKLANNARVLISFVGPTSGESLILRLKHSGEQDGPLEVTLGSTIIQLNPLSKSSLTIDDITLYPTPGPSGSDHLSFEPGIRNDIVIQFRETVEGHHHLLHDVDLLDEAGGLWRIREI